MKNTFGGGLHLFAHVTRLDSDGRQAHYVWNLSKCDEFYVDSMALVEIISMSDLYRLVPEANRSLVSPAMHSFQWFDNKEKA